LREGLPEEEAVALLRDLDPQGALGLRDAPEDDLHRAVRLTQGIPRALEILAGILHEDPTASLPKLLADEDTFGAEVVERLVAEGYRRLGEDERRIMEALAVFDRPVEETAIAYLLYPWFPGLDVRAGLRRLVSGYFVSVNRVTSEYSLHPLDRDYAYRQIPDEIERGEGRGEGYTRRSLELRAADFYAGLRKSESEWKTIDDLAPQLAEFEHRVRAGDYDGAYRVLDSIDSKYLYMWGHYTRLVELRESILGRLTDPGSRVTTLHSLGNAYRALGQFEWAIELYKESLVIIRETSDRLREKAAILGSLGRAYSALGQIKRALKLYEEALDIACKISNRKEEGIQLGHLGLAHYALGQVKRAIAYYEQALTIAREIDDQQGEGDYLASLGRAYHGLGQVERAIQYYEKALTIAREIGDRRGEGFNLVTLGSAYRALGQVERAIQYYEEALTIARETGHRRGEGVDLGHLGLVCGTLGQFEQAIQYYEKALAITREIGDRLDESTWLDNLGLAYRALGQVEQAITHHEEALTIAREIGNRLGESYCLLSLGKALLATGELYEARRCCAEALALEMPQTSYQAALALGIILLQKHDEAVGETFADAVARCQAMLDKTAGLYAPRYALAAALVGQAVCDARWAEEGERAGLLAPALEEYRRALENCAAPGVVRDALHDLEMIHAAGVEGLEPVFELLESARP
jgi:tetratricopeptide (TPR) repeat protein